MAIWSGIHGGGSAGADEQTYNNLHCAAFAAGIVFIFLERTARLRMHGILLGGILGATLLIYLLLWNPTIYTLVVIIVISIPEARYLPAKVFRPELFSKATLLHVVKFFCCHVSWFLGVFSAI